MPTPKIFIAALAMLLAPAPALACGGFFCNLNEPVEQAAERILFAVEGNEVTAHIQIAYEGPAEAFSWVLPLPAVPEFGVGTDQLFDTLHAQTDPRFVLKWENAEGCDFSNDCGCLEDVADDGGGPTGGGGGEVDVLAEGSVGPFDFKVIQSESGQALFDWLNDNGYDQPTEAAPIIEHYVGLRHVFVALQLQSDKEAGDIQPLVLTYEAPELACIPIRLTRIAALDDMPVYSWVLADARAIPLNYFHVLLNPRRFDWLRCATSEQNDGFGCSFRDPACDTAYIDLVSEAADAAGGRAFVTEYAGTTALMERQLFDEQRFNLDALRGARTPGEFLDLMLQQGFPRTPLVQQVIKAAIPKPDDAALPEDCRGDQRFYASWNIDNCVAHMPEDWTFDATAFANDLDDRIIKPLEDAQALFEAQPYMTRMFTTLSPDEMTRDPFFSFNPDLPDVSNVHRATATATCKPGSSHEASAVTFTFGDGSTRTQEGDFQSCWFGGGGGGFVEDSGAAAAIQVLNETGPPETVAADDVEGREGEIADRVPSPGQSGVPTNPDRPDAGGTPGGNPGGTPGSDATPGPGPGATADTGGSTDASGGSSDNGCGGSPLAPWLLAPLVALRRSRR